MSLKFLNNSSGTHNELRKHNESRIKLKEQFIPNVIYIDLQILLILLTYKLTVDDIKNQTFRRFMHTKMFICRK